MFEFRRKDNVTKFFFHLVRQLKKPRYIRMKQLKDTKPVAQFKFPYNCFFHSKHILFLLRDSSVFTTSNRIFTSNGGYTYCQ